MPDTPRPGSCASSLQHRGWVQQTEVHQTLQGLGLVHPVCNTEAWFNRQGSIRHSKAWVLCIQSATQRLGSIDRGPSDTPRPGSCASSLQHRGWVQQTEVHQTLQGLGLVHPVCNTEAWFNRQGSIRHSKAWVLCIQSATQRLGSTDRGPSDTPRPGSCASSLQHRGWVQ